MDKKCRHTIARRMNQISCRHGSVSTSQLLPSNKAWFPEGERRIAAATREMQNLRFFTDISSNVSPASRSSLFPSPNNDKNNINMTLRQSSSPSSEESPLVSTLILRLASSPMPSPIARSSSVPDFRAGKPSFRSNRSTCSSQSYTHGRRKPSVLLSKHRRSSKSCDLTEESLSEHNRRQAAAGKKNTECSPYYKGLLDSQRYIDRMRSVRTSPGRESIITQSSNLTSISTIIYKIQGWGSACFRGKGRKNASAAAADAADYAPPPAQPPPLQPVLRVPSPSRDVEPGNSLSSVQSEIPDSLVLKEFERRNEVRLVEQKPLRERVRTAPPKGGSVQQTQKEPTEEKFGWAKKYRPKFLKDFICNRDKVQVLQDLVGRITTPCSLDNLHPMLLLKQISY
ncbi:hypothetical protein ACLOJK_033867 [Asimina triloba]